jgi:replicative DNA helicase
MTDGAPHPADMDEGPRPAGRVPPHNLDAEASLLGAMLLSSDAISAALQVVKVEDFYKPAHAHVFDAITSLYAQGEPADPITVAEELKRAGLLDSVGGAGALVDLESQTPATSNAAYYAKIIEERAMMRKLIGVGGEVAQLGYDIPDDVDKAVDTAESLVFRIAERRITDTLLPIHQLMDLSLDRLEQLYENKGEITGLHTGFPDLDSLLGGFQPSSLVIIGARPATGKTSLALAMVAGAAIQAKKPVLMFSLEMSHIELTQRLLCSEARVDSKRIRTGQLTDDDWKRISRAVGRIGEAELWIDDNPNLTIMELRAKARRLKSQIGDLGLIVIDYLQLMSGRTSAENRQVEVSEISRGLKVLARELDTPVVALSQLSRGLEQRQDKRPTLADLRESGCVTADTRVLRADDGREVTIGELLLSGESDVPVWTLDERLKLQVGVMSNVFPTGTKRVYELRLASGRRITASGNHPFLELEGWQRLDQLVVGDRIAVARREPRPSVESAWSDDRLELLAHLIGDGCTLARHEKFIPEAVFSADDRQIALFLRHLWATDGTFSTGTAPTGRATSNIAYSSTSYDLVRGVQRLLGRLDIRARIAPATKEGCRPSFIVSVTGCEEQRRFLDLIGAFGAKAAAADRCRRALDGVTADPNVDTIPASAWTFVRKAMPEHGVTTRRLAEHLDMSYCGSDLYKSGLSRDRMARVATAIPDPLLRDLAESDVLWDRIVGIDDLGDQPVYDATVDGTHNYVANGVIIHNSLEQDADVVMFIYRDAMYDREKVDDGDTELLVAKHRNGPVGTVHLTFVPRFAKFESGAKDL